MAAMPSRAQSERYSGLLPVELSVEAPAVRGADPTNDRFQNGHPSHGTRASRPLTRFLITFYIGVAATLAWQSYSEAARRVIARLSPQLAWLAPPAAAVQAAPDPIDAITLSVDRIATTIAASQEQMTRSVDSLAAGQERMTREITRLQAIDQYLLFRNSEPPLQPTPASAPKPAAAGAQTARSRH
jgi:hypothetical protein